MLLCMEANHHNNRKFTITIQKEDEGGFSGQCLEIPGAISQGESLEELKKNMKEAIQLSIEYLEDKARKENKQVIEISA